MITQDVDVLGGVLRWLRRSALLTQEELAERSGVSVRTIRNIEAARGMTPRLSSLRALADALELDAHERLRFGALADPGSAASRGWMDRQVDGPT